MKKSIVILILALAAFSCNSNKSQLKTDLEIANLKGNVWKIDKTIHKTGNTCGCALKTECNQSRYVYDRNGNLLQSFSIDENGAINDSAAYIYNRNGLCSEIIRFSGGNMTGKEIPVIKGKKITGIKFLDENGNIKNTLEYVFSADLISEERTLDEKGGLVCSVKKEFSNGWLKSETEKDDKGATVRISSFKRNDRNDIAGLNVTIAKDNKDYKFIYEYEYDSEGNWIKQTRLFEGQIEDIVIRNIEYYKPS